MSEKMKVKIIRAIRIDDLEREINEFLASDISLIDINFECIRTSTGTSNSIIAMILYSVYENDEYNPTYDEVDDIMNAMYKENDEIPVSIKQEQKPSGEPYLIITDWKKDNE